MAGKHGFLILAIPGVVIAALGGCRKAQSPPAPAPQPVSATQPASAQAGDSSAKVAASFPAADLRRWRTEWAKGQTGRVPKWAGGYSQLVWPRGLSNDLCERWAKGRHLLGKPQAEIRSAFGEPSKVIVNESVDTTLWVYRNYTVSFFQGKCDGLAPRAANFEKWFAQPDL